MSITTAPSDAPASEWTLEGSLESSGFMDEFAAMLGADADTPATETATPPSDTGRETAATATEPKAQTPTTEADSSDADGDGDKTYTREQYERSRAEANRQRDLAKQETERAAAELAQRQADLKENEFQRGVQLRQIQLIEALTLQKGQLDLADIRAAQIQAFQEMNQARDIAVQADLRSIEDAAKQEQWTEQTAAAANMEAEAIFSRNWATLQKEAGAQGVPTFDAETALRDVLFSDEYQQDISDINSLSDRAQMKKATDRLYARAMREVRVKMTALSDAKQAIAPQNQSRTVEAVAPQIIPTTGFNLEEALENTFGDIDSYNATIQAHPKLRRG